jgi:hypothetical protein
MVRVRTGERIRDSLATVGVGDVGVSSKVDDAHVTLILDGLWHNVGSESITLLNLTVDCR